MNKQELIGKYENKLKDVQLKFGANFKTKVYEELLEDFKQLDESQPIKLKDVIARIKELDLGAREVWLNEILNELGSDYGSLKYRAGYEQDRFDCAMEHEKVTVKQFVADWYEEYKDNLEYNIWDWMKYNLEPKKKENAQFSKWIVSAEKHPVETLIKMKLYGYTVEKEKKYKVKFKNIRSGTRYLKYDGVIEKWYFGINQDSSAARLCHTKKELEEAGFGWVFDCPGVEIEEVEG